MIDKSSPRHKSENRFKIDGVSNSSIHRLRANIADVNLSLVPCVQSTKAIIAVGKHLCGAATGEKWLQLWHCLSHLINILSNTQQIWHCIVCTKLMMK